MASQNPTLRELFEVALELPEEARAPFLASRCSDSAQRARLERMLGAGPELGGALPVVSAAALAGALSDAVVADALPPGSRIGPFELVEVLGEGGSSTVFRAARTFDGVRQEVALKLLRRGLYSPDAQRQFRRERQILSQLRHPGIARLIEGGVTDTGAAYIALDLVDGVPITDYVREHRLDVRQRLLLFLDICGAVDAAHRALIVHRDLKPTNVLVTEEGVVKLLDFGIAKLLDADDDTQTRLPAFTPAYASPEQRSGGLITTATDVYALGVLLGELMTGERLTEGSSGTPSSQVSGEHELGVLPATVNVTRRQLRGDLDNIVLKALDVDPAKRYSSAGTLADDIERLLDGRPVAAHPPSTWYRARKFITRHRGGVATTVAFLLAILAALGIALWQGALAHQQARIAQAQAERADTTRRFLIGVFEQADPDANKGKAITAAQLLKKGEDELASNTAMQAGTRLDVTALIATLYWDLGDYTHAEPLLKKVAASTEDPLIASEIRARALVAMARIEGGKRLFDVAIANARQAIAAAALAGKAGDESASEARRTIASSLRGQGNSKDAEPILREALAHDRALYGDRHQSVIDDWTELGGVLTELSRFDEAIVALQTAVDLGRAVHGPMHSSVANTLQEMEGPLGYSGNYAAAERVQREALGIFNTIYGPDHRETLIARGNLFWAMESQGHYEEALNGRLAMQPALRTLAATEPEVIAAFFASIGGDQMHLGRFDDAEKSLRSALEEWRKLQGSNDEWDSADPMLALANALKLQGRFTEAETTLRKAIAIEARHEPPTSGWLNRDRGTLGEILLRQHRTAEGLAEISAAMDARRASKPDPIFCGLLARLSDAQLAAGDAQQAKETGDAAVALGRKLYPSGHLYLAGPLLALGRADLAVGLAAEAEPLLREALSISSPPHPADDPRILEINVARVAALDALGRAEEAQALRQSIEPALKASASSYAKDLLAQMKSTTNGHPR